METLFDWGLWLQNDRRWLYASAAILAGLLPLLAISTYAHLKFGAGEYVDLLLFPLRDDGPPRQPTLKERLTGSLYSFVVGSVHILYAVTFALVLMLIFVLIKPLPYNAGLRPIEPVRSLSNSTAALVFIHGWNGDDTTWKTFPQLFSADDAFADFDILMVHYPSYMRRRNLTIPQLADWISWNIDNALPGKDIYIISHSMGGVISRKLLLQRKLNRKSTGLRCIISVGSPYNGANFARLAAFLGVSEELTRDLVQGSGVLEDIKIGWRDFRKIREPVEARSICLTSPHDGVVPADSAIDQCDDFITYPRWDHSEMVRPETVTDERYSTPVGMLKRTLASFK